MENLGSQSELQTQASPTEYERWNTASQFLEDTTVETWDKENVKSKGKKNS